MSTLHHGSIYLLGFRISTPSQMPWANSVSPMNLTIPISLLANTLIPSSSIKSEDNERRAGEEDPLLVVRRLFERGLDLEVWLQS